MIYINKDIHDIYVEFNFELDANYDQGNSLNDYRAGKWVKLSDEQIAFHEANTTASIEEVLAIKLNDPDQPDTSQSTDLEKARSAKYEEIDIQDKFSNKFFISVVRFKRDANGNILVDKEGNQITEEIANMKTWMDVDMRNSMLNLTLPSLTKYGKTTTKLWSDDMLPQSIDVPITWASEKIPRLELYCKETWDLKSSLKARTYNCVTLSEIAAIDVKADYPPFLTFELNIEL